MRRFITVMTTNMKKLVILVFFVTIGTFAQAQVKLTDTKVEAQTAAVKTKVLTKTLDSTSNQELARLYRRKNARVHKALTFSTKKTRPKCT